MVTFAFLVAAGFMLGMFFNVYALAASCAVVALINFASAFDVGIGKATLSIALAIIVLQFGYFVGLTASGLFYTPKTASIPTSRR
jgi:hypothetical protein